ncbi:MAG: CDP-alcohol phosphatidyltransferase family protein [Erythrobacter sp.]|nr:CDP-alcohol phosphatidyltransferase family protein [Erythrobacter sp.]
MTVENRRPLKTRGASWAGALAKALGATGLTPNAVSTIGIGFAALGAWCFIAAPGNAWLWLGAAIGIQLRLLANMLDGMIAVEGGKSSPTGALYNEVPDRIEDALLLVAAGYAAGIPELGYGATILAFGTAYLRATGGALGFPQDFVGPLAKQHRMFVLTVGAIGCMFYSAPVIGSFVFSGPPLLLGALWIIIVGSALTCVIRTVRIARLLKQRASESKDAAA